MLIDRPVRKIESLSLLYAMKASVIHHHIESTRSSLDYHPQAGVAGPCGPNVMHEVDGQLSPYAQFSTQIS